MPTEESGPAEQSDLEALEDTIAWRMRCLDADPADVASAESVRLLEGLVTDLRRTDYGAHWQELGVLLNWLGESDAVSDYAELAADYRAQIGVANRPVDGAAYIRALQEL